MSGQDRDGDGETRGRREGAAPEWPRVDEALGPPSHTLRLSPREWIAAGLVVTVVLALLPRVWVRVERFEPEADYRVPYRLSEDYWLFGRYAAEATARDQVAVLGDSVIWGRYVQPDRTLPAYLNATAGGERFANLGVNGMHPVALAGLLEHYGEPIANSRVIVHCNLLWFGSLRHDLRVPEAGRLNHPQLVPQFGRSVPAYAADVSDRIAAVLDRHLTPRAWAAHLRLAYYEGQGVTLWSLEHPYANPLTHAVELLRDDPLAATSADAPPRVRSMDELDLPWVELDESLQWWGFRRAVEVLRRRGNRVFVLVGPFNEWVLPAESLARYQQVRGQVVAWLVGQDIAHQVAQPPPREQFADASHLRSDGHAMVAEAMVGDEAFRRFAGAGSDAPGAGP